MEKLPANKQENLEAFRAEIAELKRLEEGKSNVHFTKINPADLGEEDKEIYEKSLSDNLTSEERNEKLEEHRNRLLKHGNESQRRFAAYLANMISIKNFMRPQGE